MKSPILTRTSANIERSIFSSTATTTPAECFVRPTNKTGREKPRPCALQSSEPQRHALLFYPRPDKVWRFGRMVSLNPVGFGTFFFFLLRLSPFRVPADETY